MAKYRILALEEKHGDLHQVIPSMVEEYGQHIAAHRLGVSPFTITRWLKDNGYELERRYVRRDTKPEGAA